MRVELYEYRSGPQSYPRYYTAWRRRWPWEKTKMKENPRPRPPCTQTREERISRSLPVGSIAARISRDRGAPRRRRGCPTAETPGRYTISLLGSTSIIACSRDKHQDRRFHTVRERVSAERSAVPQRDVLALRSIGTTRKPSGYTPPRYSIGDDHAPSMLHGDTFKAPGLTGT